MVGLWNAEPRYEGTRHNVGAEVIQALSRRWDLTLKKGPLRVRADLARTSVAGASVVLALPRSLMNLSGISVHAVLRYFKATPADLLVVHDDIDLPFAKLRLHFGRGSGGHNGIRSLVGTLRTKDFHRLKIGVGRPPGSMDPADFVLRPFTKAERREVDFLVEDAADVVERFLVDQAEAVEMAARRTPPDRL